MFFNRRKKSQAKVQKHNTKENQALLEDEALTQNTSIKNKSANLKSKNKAKAKSKTNSQATKNLITPDVIDKHATVSSLDSNIESLEDNCTNNHNDIIGKSTMESDTKAKQEQETQENKEHKTKAKSQEQDSLTQSDKQDSADNKENTTLANNTVQTNTAKKDKNGQEDVPYDGKFKSRIIVVTSGKGGVGKTTTAAAISTGLAMRGHKTAVIDFDVGLRNLDLIMGVERRVVYDLINVLNNEARLTQALIKDKNIEHLYILPASQTKDKDALSYSGVGRVLKELSDMDFEYIICDSPAGIETGALMALYYADEAIVTTNPEVSSVRDSDRILGILDARSRRAVNGWDHVIPKLLLTRYIPSRVNNGEMMSVDDVQSLLSIPLLGVIPESPDVLKASNKGIPIMVLDPNSNAALAYDDAVKRLLGDKDLPLRYVEETRAWWQKLFGK